LHALTHPQHPQWIGTQRNRGVLRDTRATAMLHFMTGARDRAN
jgi:hypothetical protein